MLEALQHGCRGVARIARADHQHHRYSHQTGQFGPASLRFPETVEQSSLPFYETYIGLFAVTVVEGLQMSVRGHPRIQIGRFVVCGQRMIAQLSQLRSALERLYMQAAVAQRPHQSQGHEGLPASGHQGSDKKLWLHRLTTILLFLRSRCRCAMPAALSAIPAYASFLRLPLPAFPLRR